MIFKGHLVIINDSPFLTGDYFLLLCKAFVFFSYYLKIHGSWFLALAPFLLFEILTSFFLSSYESSTLNKIDTGAITLKINLLYRWTVVVEGPFWNLSSSSKKQTSDMDKPLSVEQIFQEFISTILSFVCIRFEMNLQLIKCRQN